VCPNARPRARACCRCILQTLAAKEGFEYILVDPGPSFSALNQTMVMACDYIIPPLFPDKFSAGSAFGLLTEVLPRWYDWHSQQLAAQDKFMRRPRLEAAREREKEREAAQPDTTQQDKVALLELFLFGHAPKILPFLLTNYHLVRRRAADADCKLLAGSPPSALHVRRLQSTDY
jgi:hypothetical protein